MSWHTCVTLALLAALCVVTLGVAEERGSASAVPDSLKFKMKSIDGEEVDLARYRGKVILVVNLASQ